DINNEKDLKKAEVLIDTKNAIGICCNKMGAIKFKVALASFEEALSLTRKYFKDDKQKLLNIMHNMGCIYYDFERYEDAIYYHSEEISLRDKKDADFIDNLNFLGYDYEAINNYEKAIGYFKQALEIIKGLEGMNSDEYMNNTYYLASVYLKMEDYENAIKCLEKSCDFIERKLGEENPCLSEALTKLSSAYIKVGKRKEALNAQLKALKVVQDSVGEKHLYYASNTKKVADIYYLEKDYEKALPYYEKETEVKRDIIGIQNEEYVNSILNLINIKMKIGKDENEYKKLEQEIYQLIDYDFPAISYKRALLILCKIYIENNRPEKLYNVYEFYKDIENRESFDDMLKNAEEIEEDIINKENKIFENESEEVEEDYDSIEEHIFDGIKNLFDGIKKEIDKYEKNYNSDEDLKDEKDGKDEEVKED
ncbi:MAG: tetratricopeptide repeat protein, partial [Eubacteriales bacterium]|nr:tetratricopeptide repeat protein [Eubacteriales bacterium]